MSVGEALFEAAAVGAAIPFFATALWLLAHLVEYKRWPGRSLARRVISWYAGFRIEGPEAGSGGGAAGECGRSCVEILAGRPPGRAAAVGVGGTDMAEFARSLGEAGFTVRGREMRRAAHLRAELDSGWSAVVLVGVRFYLDGRWSPAPLVRLVLRVLVRESLELLRHWVVVSAWEPATGRFVVRDPSLGVLSVAEGHLDRSWVGAALLARREAA